MVSHDRAFIRAVCREIVELENGKFVRYPMGWDRYVVERELGGHEWMVAGANPDPAIVSARWIACFSPSAVSGSPKPITVCPLRISARS